MLVLLLVSHIFSLGRSNISPVRQLIIDKQTQQLVQSGATCTPATFNTARIYIEPHGIHEYDMMQLEEEKGCQHGFFPGQATNGLHTTQLGLPEPS